MKWYDLRFRTFAHAFVFIGAMAAITALLRLNIGVLGLIYILSGIFNLVAHSHARRMEKKK